ncbi:hypothetical protein K2173_026866 [Erythroxylum novogranatense]|uniref:Protein kinase domain-containing protein n=1 Tax=Erythroxylum novogranatense TaxID=1862640 RepID=A0AAV8U0M9_9ROSI|nr:hypothetical protein K2173_026866 [Erythroxylum novogranatense]
MGNCCSCFAPKSTSVTATVATVVSVTAPTSIPSPDAGPTSVGHLSDGDTSFLRTNASGNSWFSMATTNFTTRISQASGAIAAIWANGGPVDVENEFPAGLDDEEGATAMDAVTVKAFTFAQLKTATSNFRNDLVLGRGGFGRVYKGWLNENDHSTRKRAIAVKKLDSTSKQGIRQWRTEVGFLRRLNHPNIVKLVGYYRGNAELMIVYEFMQEGSLNYHLFGRGSGRLLPWGKRVKIATEMARGLSYLHTMDTPIIYRDFKSSNVLLDKYYRPKISDFGLAKWGPRAGNPCVTGHVMGTIGYAAPEYVSTGNLYVKSDVYSFGVVLVEMLTGLRAIDKKRPTWQRNLITWTKPVLSDKRRLRQIMDPRLDGKYSLREAFQMAILALKCLHEKPQFRPSMKEVAETLQDIGAYHATA